MAVWLSREILELQKIFEDLERFDDFGLEGLAGNPHFILFGIHSALVDDTQSNVDNVVVDHGVAGAASVGTAAEESQDKYLKTVGRLPISGHLFLVFFTIFG